MSPEEVMHVIQVSLMVILVLGENQDVIDISANKDTKVISKYIIHYALEG